MLKRYGIIKKVGQVISEAANQTCKSVLDDYKDIIGREEEITPQLRGEINRHLLENIKEKVNDMEIKECVIQVSTFKKAQETNVGADLAGIIDFKHGDTEISKVYLAQAKVGKVVDDARGGTHVKAYSGNLLKQVDDMLKLSSDSFVFIYTLEGIFCIPALQVKLGGTRSISTKDYPYHTFGAFYEEFFKCFIGDHKISPNSIGASDLEDYANKLNAKAVLQFRITLPTELNVN